MDWNKQSLVKLQQVQTYVRQNRGMYVGKGKWMVSFTAIFLFRDHGTYREARVNGVMEVKDKDFLDEAEIDAFCIEAAEKYIKKTPTWHASSVDFINKRAVVIRLMTDIQLKNLRLYGTALEYKLLPENLEINKNGGSCVRNFIMANTEQVWSKYTRFDLNRELLNLGIPEEQDWLDVESIMEWVESKKHVTMFAFGPHDQLIAKYVAPVKTQMTLAFKINNNHLYPVMQKDLKLRVSKTGKLDLQNEVFKIKNWNSAAFTTCADILENKFPQEKILYVNDVDLCAPINETSLVAEIMKQTGFIPNMKFRSVGSQLEMIEHPTTGQIIVSSPDYQERTKVCADLYNEFELVEFKFSNQSWATFTKDIMQIKVGRWPTSVYGPDMNRIIQDFPLKPYIVQFPYTVTPFDKIVSADYRRDYTSILLNNEEDIPIFGIGDDIQTFTPGMKLLVGEYYVNRPIVAGKGHLKHPRGFYPSVVIKYWISKGYINQNDIKYCILASQVLKANTFKETIQWILKKWPKESKNLINCWIGSLGQTVMKSSKAGLTDSWETALATSFDDPSVNIFDIHDFYLLRKQTKVRLGKGNYPIFRHIIAASYAMLDKMTDIVCGPDTQVVMYNTDCIKVINPNPTWVPTDPAVAQPGDILLEPQPENGFVIKGTQFAAIPDGDEYNHTFNEWQPINGETFKVMGGSACISAGAGYGKTELLKDMYIENARENKKMVILAFTNTATDEPRSRISSQLGKFDNAKTFDTYFTDSESTEQHIALGIQNDIICVEEVFSTPKKWMSLLYQIKQRKPEIVMRFYGHDKQNHPTESDNMWYDYTKCAFFHELCDSTMVELQYIEGCSRYTKELKAVLDQFLAKGTLPASFGKKLWNSTECEFNITATRKDTINKIDDVFLKKYSMEKAWFDGKNRWVRGMPMIAYGNLKVNHLDDNNEVIGSLAICNSQHYTFESCDGTNCVLMKDGKSYKVSKDVFKLFEYGFADTVYRIQGRTLRSKYNIFQSDKMFGQGMYVALSRATCVEDIGLIAPKGKVWEWEKPPSPGKLAQIYRMEELKEGADEKFTQKWGVKRGNIYEAYDSQGNRYIGSTAGPVSKSKEDILNDRIAGHIAKAMSDNPVKRMKDWVTHADVKWKILDSFKFINVKSLTDVEYWYISQLEPEKAMNTKGVVQTAAAAVAPEIVPVDKRFKINHEEKNKRYSITYRINGKLSSHRFSYAEKMTQEEALKAAETKQEEIRREYL